jgi:hypothetical protein
MEVTYLCPPWLSGSYHLYRYRLGGGAAGSNGAYSSWIQHAAVKATGGG